MAVACLYPLFSEPTLLLLIFVSIQIGADGFFLRLNPVFQRKVLGVHGETIYLIKNGAVTYSDLVMPKPHVHNESRLLKCDTNCTYIRMDWSTYPNETVAYRMILSSTDSKILKKPKIDLPAQGQVLTRMPAFSSFYIEFSCESGGGGEAAISMTMYYTIRQLAPEMVYNSSSENRTLLPMTYMPASTKNNVLIFKMPKHCDSDWTTAYIVLGVVLGWLLGLPLLTCLCMITYYICGAVQSKTKVLTVKMNVHRPAREANLGQELQTASDLELHQMSGIVPHEQMPTNPEETVNEDDTLTIQASGQQPAFVGNNCIPREIVHTSNCPSAYLQLGSSDEEWWRKIELHTIRNPLFVELSHTSWPFAKQWRNIVRRLPAVNKEARSGCMKFSSGKRPCAYPYPEPQVKHIRDVVCSERAEPVNSECLLKALNDWINGNGGKATVGDLWDVFKKIDLDGAARHFFHDYFHD